MSIRKGFSLLILSDSDISDEKMNKCYKALIEHDLKGFDYESKKYMEFEKVLNKYPDEQDYTLRYENLTFVVADAKGKNFLSATMDAASGAQIIVKLTKEFINIIDHVQFAYIDDDGGLPKTIQKIVNNHEIKWLFKYNFFGENFLVKYGQNFFTQMPCEKVEFINDNIVRVDLCKDIFTAIDRKLMTEIDAYLSKFSLRARFYDYHKRSVE